MTRFAERTGLTTDRPQQRYLWTDAFAVCNFLAAGELELAERLVDRVHHILGRHRADDPRRGWISGLPDAVGETHPALGGLRIGKPLPERAPGAPLDERLEWDRDGQYFHYLTKWMHALDQLARATGQARYSVLARELADTASRTFVYGAPGRKMMHWKMSVDLTRPLVASMGHHDPLDGYITCLELDATREQLPAPGPDLAGATADYRAMIRTDALATSDPLGLGGLLVDAHRLAQLGRDRALRDAVVAAAELGLRYYAAEYEPRLPAERRLGFRELGLAIGLTAAAALDDARRFAPYAAIGEQIVAFWSAPEHRLARTWTEHADINDVMLATALAPQGFLLLRPAARRGEPVQPSYP